VVTLCRLGTVSVDFCSSEALLGLLVLGDGRTLGGERTANGMGSSPDWGGLRW
jgi:hypothetical protein